MYVLNKKKQKNQTNKKKTPVLFNISCEIRCNNKADKHEEKKS